mgnify:CR=1 FL=1
MSFRSVQKIFPTPLNWAEAENWSIHALRNRRVLQSDVEGMTWGIWDEVVLEILFPVVVIPERSMGETVINVGG